MACSIINRTTQTTIGRNEVLDQSQSPVSALQRPDINRMNLNALMRKQMRVRQGTSRLFWSQLLSRCETANTNIVQPAAV